MKAIVYHEYGPPDVLRYADVDQPAPGRGEVLIQVKAASLNFGDRAAMHGKPSIMRLAFGLKRPKRTILGRDVAGVVAEVGAGVTKWRVGDEVFGELEQRGFAEYAVAPAHHLARKPAGVTFEQAATLPVAGSTALQSARRGGVGPGRTVLVNGATGGVGLFAVQLSAAQGAEVTGVCRTGNADLVHSVGATHIVDYTKDDLARTAKRFDVIIDLAGSQSLRTMRRLLTPKGVYVCTTGAGGDLLGPLPRLAQAGLTSPFVSQSLRVLAQSRNVDDLDALARMVAEGTLTPVIERTYPLSEAAQAIRELEANHARGKVVLVV